MIKSLITLLLLCCIINSGSAIYCYRCVSSHPGCSTPFNWRGIGYLGTKCPEDDDVCVKIVERKGASEFITRECLSVLRSFRTDIPADHYEGCRAAAQDVRLAHYVDMNIKELDIRRDYYDSTTWCFCFLDHRCNSASFLTSSMYMIIATVTCLWIHSFGSMTP